MCKHGGSRGSRQAGGANSQLEGWTWGKEVLGSLLVSLAKKKTKKSESADPLSWKLLVSQATSFECNNKKQAAKRQIEKIDCGCECLTV